MKAEMVNETKILFEGDDGLSSAKVFPIGMKYVFALVRKDKINPLKLYWPPVELEDLL